jgi:hypothetical protein
MDIFIDLNGEICYFMYEYTLDANKCQLTHVCIHNIDAILYILIENQQMHQNDHFIVMSSQTLLHVSAY